METWKTIPETDGLYSVSNFGNVRRNEHYTTVKPNIQKQNETVAFYKEKLIKSYKDASGYLVVSLRDKKGHTYRRKIHRLVAQLFVPNPNKLDIVNHKDENKTNNTASNLEWCTSSYNSNYGTRNTRIQKALSNKVAQYTIDGQLIKVWNSMSEAARFLGASTTTYIRRACTGQFGRKTYKGSVWKYVDDNQQLINVIKRTFSKEELQEIVNQYDAR